MGLFTRGYGAYTKELSKAEYEPLDSETERTLLEAYVLKKDKAAFNTIVKAHLRFVTYLLKFNKVPNNIDIMDVIQEGNIGLIIAINRFKLKYECRVATYAARWIQFYFTKYIALQRKNNFSGIDIHETDTLNIVQGETVDVVAVSEDIANFLHEHLDKRTAKIISLYAGLEYPYAKRSLKDIGTMFSKHPERIRQIIESGIVLLKEKINFVDLSNRS